jgi:hypothetical protein
MKKARPKQMYSKEDRKNLHDPGYSGMDAGIREAVRILIENGIETIQSCQGGTGHAYPEPTVEFTGSFGAGFRALAVAMEHGLQVSELRRVWSMQDGEPVGPHWAMTFRIPVRPSSRSGK